MVKTVDFDFGSREYTGEQRTLDERNFMMSPAVTELMIDCVWDVVGQVIVKCAAVFEGEELGAVANPEDRHSSIKRGS